MGGWRRSEFNLQFESLREKSEMPKLFVALDLPAEATAELIKIQPPNTDAIRLVAQSQMHVTLHYLGEADIARVSAILQRISVPAFRLEIERVGQFQSAGGSTTMWAGVKKSLELIALHNVVSAALSTEGYQPESRPYTPHISIARCEPDAPADVVTDFLEKHSSFSLPPVTIIGFGLYSSQFVQNAPVYVCESSFRCCGKADP